MSRPPGKEHGHVGFYTGEDSDVITMLGGNQGDSVSIQDYRKDRWLGFRWPA
ncbi:MAG: hypothetical protein ABFD97_24030 [Syntrophobacter sp.]